MEAYVVYVLDNNQSAKPIKVICTSKNRFDRAVNDWRTFVSCPKWRAALNLSAIDVCIL